MERLTFILLLVLEEKRKQEEIDRLYEESEGQLFI
jgi:hypothetical protein